MYTVCRAACSGSQLLTLAKDSLPQDREITELVNKPLQTESD
jgi:hypothetical protein